MSIRIGFYICHCGINIAGMVRVEEVAAYIATLPGVTIARDYKFMCSDPGQELIEKDIRELHLNRVVVASCSPRLHEKTFRAACARAGLNPYYFQMASVREQVSWVTKDRDLATQKAKNLSGAAVTRVRHHRPLETRHVSIHPDILVVGGGIAGMQAALDIGQSGLTAHLVEKSTTIGGHMLQYDKTFPTLDCAACIGTPKMVETAQDPNISLHSNSEITDVSGFIGNYTVTIRKNPRYVQETCTGCGECEKVCPVSIPSKWDMGLSKRKAIYRVFPQAVPITFAVDKRKTAPCRLACPAQVNVQGYVQMARVGKYQEALNIIMERLPLPGVLGRVCPHPCESLCRRADVDSPIAIRNLKRFISDEASPMAVSPPRERAERVAIVGSGPGGLTAAYYLRQKGFQVTLFEKEKKLGGMLRWGIPDYRLPPELLDREIAHIIQTGITVKTEVCLGRDFTLHELQEEDFSAVILGTGAELPIRLNISGEENPGVLDAVPFLKSVNDKKTKEISGTVVVIGGGNVAMDAARCAGRLGARRVVILYRRTEMEMPAQKEEIRDAREEGIEILTLASPMEIMVEEGRLKGVQCIKNRLGTPDRSGRRAPVPVEGSEFLLEADLVIPAVGQRPDTPWQDSAIQLSPWGTVQVNPDTMETTMEGIFCLGDAVTGPATVIEAVAAGHQVVAAVEQRLSASRPDLEEMSQGVLENKNDEAEEYLPIPEDVAIASRAEPLNLDPDERRLSFEEVDRGFTRETATAEAERCLNCGGCCECMQCVEACQVKAVDHEMKREEEKIKVGSIIVATGFDPMDPTPMTQFGYDRFPNVITNMEFERLSNATGPTGGKILLRDEKGRFAAPPKSVAILHCIGSRDINYHTYCSRVCCMYALKYAHLLHEKCGGETLITNFYIDMRCFGKGYEEFYQRCQEEGTRFVRGKAAQVRMEPVTGKLMVLAEDTLMGEVMETPVEMVILCTAMEARKDSRDMGRILGINQGADGFFLEEHPKLAPLSTATDGVFLAGTCQGPKDIPDTVAQASGAAAKSLALATKGEVEISSTISFIDPDICAGCKTCIGLCPYSAIDFDEKRGVSVVNEALCKGCGSCSGFCPSGAAQVRHFNQKQLVAELEGLFETMEAK